MKKKVLGIGILFAVLLIYVICVSDKEEVVEPEFVLTYAENQAADYPTTRGAYKFAELVAERTGGKVLIEIKHSGELGTQSDVIKQLQFGGIDLARVSLSSLSDEFSRMNVLQLPFLYEDEEQMWNVLKSEIGSVFIGSLQEMDLIGLSWYEAGTRCFYSSNEPIETIEDLQGKVVRVQESEMMKDWIKMLGGEPVVVPYTDVYAAFETGIIEVAENNWNSYASEEHYEVAKYFTVDEHTRVPELQLISNVTWNKLPIIYRHIILESAEDSAEYEKEIWDEETEKAKQKAIENGCEVIIWTDEEIQKCKDMLEPLYQKYCASYLYLIEDIQTHKKY